MKWPLSRRAIPDAAGVLARIGLILLMSIGAVASRAALLCEVRAGVRLVRAGVRCIGLRPRAGGVPVKSDRCSGRNRCAWMFMPSV